MHAIDCTTYVERCKEMFLQEEARKRREKRLQEEERQKASKSILSGADFMNIIAGIAVLYCLIMICTYIKNKMSGVSDEDSISISEEYIYVDYESENSQAHNSSDQGSFRKFNMNESIGNLSMEGSDHRRYDSRGGESNGRRTRRYKEPAVSLSHDNRGYKVVRVKRPRIMQQIDHRPDEVAAPRGP